MNHIITTPHKSFVNLVNTNFLGTFLFTREVSKLMMKNGGKIINFSTVASPLNLEVRQYMLLLKLQLRSLLKFHQKNYLILILQLIVLDQHQYIQI